VILIINFKGYDSLNVLFKQTKTSYKRNVVKSVQIK